MSTKTRTYTGIFYPADGVVPLVPLIEHMKSIMLPGIISPIHAADEKEKKSHVHFMVDYPNAVRLDTARSDFAAVSANGYLEPVRSRKSMMRYMLHLDDEDKEQLDPDDVLTICGAIFDTTLDLTADDIMRIVIELQDYCDDHGIVEYSDLCRMVRALEKYDWYRVLYTHTVHFSAYLRSARHKEDTKERR